MHDHYYAVIMAGGGGTRLWPLSRRARPKQMLHLFEHRSLFQIAVSRLDGLFPPERILVVTVEEQAQQLQQSCPEIPAENYLLEPLPRGTASVVGLAAVALRDRDRQATMAVLTSDHYIREEERFRKLLSAAHDLAHEDYLVTLGIRPTFPATGYGYINLGDAIQEYDGMIAYQAIRFIEKPERSRAAEMLREGNYTWNSGMFVWQVERILSEVEAHMPTLHDSLEKIALSWKTPDRRKTMERLWPEIVPQTIDYGIMEKAQCVALRCDPIGSEWEHCG